MGEEERKTLEREEELAKEMAEAAARVRGSSGGVRYFLEEQVDTYKQCVIAFRDAYSEAYAQEDEARRKKEDDGGGLDEWLGLFDDGVKGEEGKAGKGEEGEVGKATTAATAAREEKI